MQLVARNEMLESVKGRNATKRYIVNTAEAHEIISLLNVALMADS